MDADINFNDYLISKKINAAEFQSAEREKYQELENIFLQMHPDSFTAQKLFLINPIRRNYPISEEVTNNPTKPKNKFKPKIK